MAHLSHLYRFGPDKLSFELRLAIHKKELNYFLHVTAQLIETFSLTMSSRKARHVADI